MAKTLGFTVSISNFKTSAHSSHIKFSSSLFNSSPPLSTCTLRNGLQLTLNPERGSCRSCFNPSKFSAEAVDSSTKLEEIRWDSGDRVGRENATQVLRNDTTSVANSNDSLSASTHVERAWEHWNKLGAPKLVVAPMMDQSELPFRMLCRKYGATAAYTQMLHSRPFALQPGYRRVEFSTCPVRYMLSQHSEFLKWVLRSLCNCKRSGHCEMWFQWIVHVALR